MVANWADILQYQHLKKYLNTCTWRLPWERHLSPLPGCCFCRWKIPAHQIMYFVLADEKYMPIPYEIDIFSQEYANGIMKNMNDCDHHPLPLPEFHLSIILRRVHIQCQTREVIRLQLPGFVCISISLFWNCMNLEFLAFIILVFGFSAYSN